MHQCSIVQPYKKFDTNITEWTVEVKQIAFLINFIVFAVGCLAIYWYWFLMNIFNLYARSEPHPKSVFNFNDHTFHWSNINRANEPLLFYEHSMNARAHSRTLFIFQKWRRIFCFNWWHNKLELIIN